MDTYEIINNGWGQIRELAELVMSAIGYSRGLVFDDQVRRTAQDGSRLAARLAPKGFP